MDFLNTTPYSSDCISCVTPTEMVTKCCKASICPDCITEWLRRKRECMHCKADQLSFDDWVENYRDPDLVPPPPPQPETIMLQGVLHYWYPGEDSESAEDQFLDVAQQAVEEAMYHALTSGFLGEHYAQTIDANAFIQIIQNTFGNVEMTPLAHFDFNYQNDD